MELTIIAVVGVIAVVAVAAVSQRIAVAAPLSLVVVGIGLSFLLPGLGLASALALGAIISPTDAVASPDRSSSRSLRSRPRPRLELS